MSRLLLILLVWPGLSVLAADVPPLYRIQNITIHDGLGKPGFTGDVLIRGDRIAAVGQVPPVAGAKLIDGAGLVICPGFIDLHTHCDGGSQSLSSEVGKANRNYVAQGCTTVVTGNCGSGPVGVAEWFAKLEKGGIGTNVIHLAPHNSIRERVMGNSNRVPTAEEQAKMEVLVDQAMKDGAWGLATGLIYNPGTYSQTSEIVGLAKVVSRHGGLYASHIRDEGSGLLTALNEAIAIGREAGCPVHISHIKASGRSAWGASVQAVALIEQARKSGLRVTADQYPYIASSTSLRATVVPSRYREGSQKDFLTRLDDPTIGPKMKADIERAIGGRDGGKRIQIARFSKKPQWQGRNLAEIASTEGQTPLAIVLEIERNGGAQIVNFGMSEEDVRVYMKRDWVATASDGGVQQPGDTVPHPRSYGTFPRKIGRYALEDGILPLEQAIRSSTGLPAEILKLKDRGVLKAGNYADLVIFDPKTFRDTATFPKPHQYPTGVKWVFVNGVAVIADGQYDSRRLGGKVLKHLSSK